MVLQRCSLQHLILHSIFIFFEFIILPHLTNILLDTIYLFWLNHKQILTENCTTNNDLYKYPNQSPDLASLDCFIK